ncbi:TetR/AcrR family transcriptional regulator [Paraburkholderia dipogonis]|uniref:TetR/AcrR family transcriptional regulator n=1 Tax=Paraburkholderia dipogonis TaxID=1211383 RepID=A0A4Y8MWR1_9BURK|nr:TetR/AcrR family transcriptional regulator [Paraburkholderia dipogonis]TFE41990.1 TetR/AcrR family transcriptional regulator [Paraburkholderia dipogonis]
MYMRSILLDESERLIRTKGFVPFSLAELSKELSIPENRVTEYFVNKDGVCVELLDRTIARFERELDEIYTEYGDAGSRLIAYACLRSEEFVRGLPSLSAALIAVTASLSDAIRQCFDRFLALQLNWIKTVLEGHFASCGGHAEVSMRPIAHLLLVTLEVDDLLDGAENRSEPSAASYSVLLTILGIVKGKA